MKIAVVGTGYVGLVTGTCFAQMGNSVTCVDIDQNKIDRLKLGKIPIYEPGLEELVLQNQKIGTLRFSTDLSSIMDQLDLVFIAVGTPPGANGSADLTAVLKVASQIGQYMRSRLVIVDKSTVPVGTADRVSQIIGEELKKRAVDYPFSVVSNPEFLKEGAAIEDFMKPDRIIVGASDEWAFELMTELYKPFEMNSNRLIKMDLRSAEMTKYAANAMLATKISFINEMANICERVGADVNQVRLGIGSDTRIGYSFIYPGAGYGGSCFPKDVQALVKTAIEYGYEPQLLKGVESVNENQKKVLMRKVHEIFGQNIQGLTFAVWGLAFKPDTDDMREASSVVLIKDLLAKGALVQAYDPKAVDEAKKHYLKDLQNLSYANSKYQALEGASALLLVTEWKEFRSPDFDEIGKLLKQKVIIDGRNQYNAEKLKGMGFTYSQIGVGH